MDSPAGSQQVSRTGINRGLLIRGSGSGFEEYNLDTTTFTGFGHTSRSVVVTDHSKIVPHLFRKVIVIVPNVR